ncbi:Gamma-tubulin complex component 6 [Chlorella vulgaris]
MASDYGQQVLRERRQLLGDLVTRLTGLQVDEARHSALLEACFEAAQHHQFPDINPRHVAEQVDRLTERLGEHAQFSKQRALQLLQTRLLGLRLDSTQYDFQHRLLSFLYCCSRRPLSTAYDGGGELVAALETAARTAVVGPPTYLTDGSEDSWQDELGACSPRSQLSNWSDSEAEELGSTAGTAGATAVGTAGAIAGGAAAGTAGGTAAADHETGAPAGTAPDTAGDAAAPRQTARSAALHLAGNCKLSPPPPLPRRESPYHRASLSVWLASKQSEGHPERVLEPRLCFHESELVQQVIHMLKGLCSPGPAFELDSAREAYVPRKGVHLHCSSHGSLRVLLQRFARTATALRRVQRFCTAVQSAAGSPPGPWLASAAPGSHRQLLSLPTVAAFAAAVAEQLQGLQQQVLVVEAALSSGALLSLLQLQQRTASLAEQAALLEGLVQRCCRRRGSAAESAAGLLSGLHEGLEVQLLQARSQGGVPAAMLLRIFTAACRPLLGTLHGWLYRGVLHDPWAECFVQHSGDDIPTDSPRFWSEAYTLRLGSNGGGGAGGGGHPVAAAPSFLLPLAPSILAAGKTSLLLHAHSAWRMAAAAAAARSGGAGGGAALPPPLAAVPAEAAESPSKRRLSEYGALGFAIATGRQGSQEQQLHQPYGMPPSAAAAALPDSLMLLGGEGEAAGVVPGSEPPPLHQQLLHNLEAQLQQHLKVAHSSVMPHCGSPAPAQHQHQGPHQQQQLFGTTSGADGGAAAAGNATAAAAAAGAADGEEASGSGSGSSGSRSPCWGLLQEWQPAGALADDYNLLLLPKSDTLPQLLALPASAEGLPAAKEAIIFSCEPDSVLTAPVPAAARQGSLPGSGSGSNCRGSGHGSGEASSSDRSSGIGGDKQADTSSSRGQRELSMAERMQHAAAARVRQATGAALEQLPLLLIPPAPLADLASAAAAAATGVIAAEQSSPGAVEATDGNGGAVLAAAEVPGAGGQLFDSSSWQRYYRQVSAALAQQLDVLDCLGGGRQPASSYGVWGCGGGSCPNTGLLVQQQPLQPALVVEAPPLQVLLQHSLLQPVQAQVDVCGAALCTALLRHGLMRQLAALRDVYLLGSPLLQPFVSFLLRRISTTSGGGATGMDRISEFELNACLQDSLAAGGNTQVLRISAQLLPAAPGSSRPGGGGHPEQRGAAAAGGGGVRLVQQLSRLRLRVEPGWPLSLVVGEEMLEQYNVVLVLLLQLSWVKQSLQAVRYAGWKACRRGTQNAAARDGLQHQMVHLVDSVSQYVSDRVAAAGAWLEQAVQGCTSLDQMHARRSKYQRAVTRYCLLSSEGVARLVHEGLLHLLNACLTYCSLRQQQAATAAALAALSEAAGGPAAAALGGSVAQRQQQQQQQQREQQQRAQLEPATLEQQQEEDEEEDAGAREGLPAGMPAGGVPWAGRRAELQRRSVDASQQLARLRRDFGNRRRLLLRVLATKAAEAGSHADELRQLLAALDFNAFFERSMMP